MDETFGGADVAAEVETIVDQSTFHHRSMEWKQEQPIRLQHGHWRTTITSSLVTRRLELIVGPTSQSCTVVGPLSKLSTSLQSDILTFCWRGTDNSPGVRQATRARRDYCHECP